MPAGYSKRPLIDKLGIKPGYRIYFHNSPENFAGLLGRLPEDTNLETNFSAEYDFIHFFTKSLVDLQARLPDFKNALKQNGMIWVSWPKKASKIATDLNENIIREIALQKGLVDIKVCAVDETWSGLKLVIPVKDRK